MDELTVERFGQPEKRRRSKSEPPDTPAEIEQRRRVAEAALRGATWGRRRPPRQATAA